MENNNNNNNNSSSCIMMENNNNNNNNNIGLYPMIMIPPHLSHQHHQNHNSHHNHNNNSNNNNNNKHHHQQHQLCCSSASCSSTAAAAAAAAASGCYDHLMEMENQQHQQQQSQQHNLSNNNNNSSVGASSDSIKAKIMAHPHYPRLLSAFVNCQKVGAPPEVLARLEEAETMAMNHHHHHQQQQSGGRNNHNHNNHNNNGFVNVGDDPALDQFMEAYCEMLTKYEQELTKPFKEAMLFLSRIECQFKALTISSSSESPSSACGEVGDRNGSSEEDIDVNNNFIDPSAEDRELKGQLLRKYSGYIGSLRQEFLKKRKKGKLPKEARQQLLDWWSRHYKWPYPSESQKLALAEATGLDQKQINNWFINQRKRHWKPSEDMQFVVMDAAAHSHPHPHYGYMENVLGNPFPMDVSPTLM